MWKLLAFLVFFVVVSPQIGADRGAINQDGIGEHEEEEEMGALGDSETSSSAKNTLIQAVDYDNDGDISPQEVQRFINDTGGKLLDEQEEIMHAADLSFDALDGNTDKSLSNVELKDYWSTIAHLLSVDEVRDWAAHAMQLPPAVVQRFVDLGVTGYDFPELLANDGDLLASELGVSIKSVRQRIMRGMRMKLMGMGRAPSMVGVLSAEPSSCVHSTVKWSLVQALDTDDMSLPVHKYVVQRQVEVAQLTNEIGRAHV